MIVVLQYLGTVVFAISGALTAGRRRLDVFGVVVLAVAVAVGGGTLRDLVLGVRPVFWVSEPGYIVTAVVTALAVVAGARFGLLADDARWQSRALDVADAFGLGLFTIVGAWMTWQLGFGPVVVVTMAVVTSTFGGLLRDLMADIVPHLLHREIYATAALAGAVLFVALTYVSREPWISLPPVALTIVLRLVSMRRGWAAPLFAHGEPLGLDHHPARADVGVEE